MGTDCFPDVKEEWFAPYVCTAKRDGIIAGYPDGAFKPEQPISFVEAAKILIKAYDLSPEGGGEWYTPFVLALESGKAIPPSINALDRKITLGEMAEMMWRISEKKMDQPTKGLLNIKYPEAKINFASDRVQVAQSCADIRPLVSES